MRAVSDERSTPAEDGTAISAGRVARTGRRLIAVVVALGVVAALAGGWAVDAVGSVTPAQSSTSLTQHVGLSTVALSVGSPSGSGQVLMLRVTDVSGAPVDGARLQCDLSMLGMAMSLPTIVATSAGAPGEYQCRAPALDPGAWSLALTLTLTSGETDHATFRFDEA